MRLTVVVNDDPIGSACPDVASTDEESLPDDDLVRAMERYEQGQQEPPPSPSAVSLYNESLDQETGEWSTERVLCPCCRLAGDETSLTPAEQQHQADQVVTVQPPAY
jgi:hypothetical protein